MKYVCFICGKLFYSNNIILKNDYRFSAQLIFCKKCFEKEGAHW